MQTDDWSEYTDDQSQYEASQSQTVGNSQAFLFAQTDLDQSLPQEQQKPVGHGQKKRHLFTVHSGSH